MDEEDKNNINKEEDKKIDETQSEGEKSPDDTSSVVTSEKISETDVEKQPKDEIQETEDTKHEINPSGEEEKKEHEVIHKKDGRLHIYVRQDKYKGELKSKNWVGRLYIDGKQKIKSTNPIF